MEVGDENEAWSHDNIVEGLDKVDGNDGNDHAKLINNIQEALDYNITFCIHLVMEPVHTALELMLRVWKDFLKNCCRLQRSRAMS